MVTSHVLQPKHFVCVNACKIHLYRVFQQEIGRAPSIGWWERSCRVPHIMLKRMWRHKFCNSDISLFHAWAADLKYKYVASSTLAVGEFACTVTMASIKEAIYILQALS